MAETIKKIAFENKIYNVGDTPDWNANQGETGYIKNKPLTDIKQKSILKINKSWAVDDPTGFFILYGYYQFDYSTFLNINPKHTFDIKINDRIYKNCKCVNFTNDEFVECQFLYNGLSFINCSQEESFIEYNYALIHGDIPDMEDALIYCPQNFEILENIADEIENVFLPQNNGAFEFINNGSRIFGNNNSIGYWCHAEGSQTTATNWYSHAEGYQTKATNYASHAEGDATVSSGNSSHSEGYMTSASGQCAHSEGNQTKAKGINSHAEGENTTAEGKNTHTEGCFTSAINNYEHSSGCYNISNKNNENFGSAYNTLFSVGNGATNNRHNAIEIKQSGDIFFPDTKASGQYYQKPMICLQDKIAELEKTIANLQSEIAKLK